MLCSERFTARDAVSLRGAQIGGNLVLEQARLMNPGGRALPAASLVVDKGMFCTQGSALRARSTCVVLTSVGTLSSPGRSCATSVGTRSRLPDSPWRRTCSAGPSTPPTVSQRKFTAEGEIRLVGAHIKGTLDCASATLTNPVGSALGADGLTVDQDMFCSEGFSAEGEVRLLRAQIGGSLNFDAATLTNPEGPALDADGLTVGHGMVCRDGFTAHGEVSLHRAHIGAQLDFSGATLTNLGGWLLTWRGCSPPPCSFAGCQRHLSGSTSSMPRSGTSPTTQQAGPTSATLHL